MKFKDLIKKAQHCKETNKQDIHQAWWGHGLGVIPTKARTAFSGNCYWDLMMENGP